MILARTVTRSYDFYQEVEITDELIGHLEQVFDYKLELDNNDYDLLWSNLEEMHDEDGNIIMQEKQYMPDQSYDDVCEYFIIDKSNLIETEYV